jgi:hypothetical protein
VKAIFAQFELARNPLTRLVISAVLRARYTHALRDVEKPFTARASYRLDRTIVALENFVTATARADS